MNATPSHSRYSLIVFFALAYLISWASYRVLGSPSIFTLGPALAALILAVATGGLAGLRDLLGRTFRWRVGLRWHAAAIFVPIAIGLAMVGLTIALGAPKPTAAQLGPWYRPFVVAAGVVISLDTLFEEMGWRGYAMPRFPADRSPLVNTLILGVLVAGWHIPVALQEPELLAPYLIATIASMVVTNWVYYNGRESALLAWMYHSSANTMGLYFAPMFTGRDHVTYVWLLAAVNCVAAVVVIVATGPSLGRKSPSPAATAPGGS
jgi:membrane protease YdiL (CAAX protease family)